MKLPLAFVLYGLLVSAGEGSAPRGQLTSGTATLLSRDKHRDYEKATFSFEHGIRDDPGLRITHNDWDLEFGNGGDAFDVCMVTDDRSVIVDLGTKGFDEITALPAFPAFKQYVTTQVDAIEGHAYAVHTCDDDSDSFSLFRVAKLLPGDECTIEWVHWEPGPAAELELAPATRTRLSAVLDGATQVQEGEPLRDPVDILLRVSTGMQGGNSSSVALDGSTDRLPEEMESESETPRPRTGGNSSWYHRGGFIPKDRVLVVESVDLFAMAPGDKNGHGEAILRLPSGPIFEIRDEGGPFQVWFEGLELVRPRYERGFIAEVANSSALEARVRGRLVTVEEATRLERRPFLPAAAPAGLPRAGGEVDARRFLLERPSFDLQVRSGAGGGNPNRVTMLGRGSIYLDSISTEPIDLAAPIDMREKSVGYTDGGRIPRDCVLVVESVDVFAMASGDTNGHGEAIVQLPSGPIFQIRDEEGPFQIWLEGLEVVRPGQEERVFAEVANSSVLAASVRGRFVTREEAARLVRQPFYPAAAPAGLPRAGGEVDARRFLLERPSLVLQVRSGAGGGNPNRVTMLGRGSSYLESMSNEPIDLAAPIDMHEESVGYTDGGRIPRERVFLVKKVTWRARAAGDSNGHGEALLRIGSQEIFRIRDTAGEQHGTWTGEVEIHPGEEASTYLEVANSSLAEARLEGEWR